MAFQPGVGFSFADDASGASTAVSVTGVTVGDLLVAYVVFEGGGTTISVGDGTNTFQNGAIGVDSASGANGRTMFAYLLASTLSGSITVTATLGVARTFRRIHVWRFSYTNTASLDVESGIENGTDTSPTSIAATTTGTDEVVVAGEANFSGVGSWVTSSPLINGVAADNSILDTGSTMSTWYRILTATFSNGTGTCTLNAAPSGSLCHITSFKATAGAPAPTADPAFASTIFRSRMRTW